MHGASSPSIQAGKRNNQVWARWPDAFNFLKTSRPRGHPMPVPAARPGLACLTFRQLDINKCCTELWQVSHLAPRNCAQAPRSDRALRDTHRALRHTHGGLDTRRISFILALCLLREHITEVCHDRIIVASDIAKFMNGAGKIHERFMNRKKTTAAVSCAIHERLRFFIPAHI